MIIDRIRAQNVLKYAELTIELEARKLIAISGQNESGKSSIGETVCFALFGRTFSIRPEEIEKVVRWGENHCHVELEFSVEDRRYVLTRFLDRDGNHSAKLVRADRPDEPVARGVQQVADALLGILGYDFDEFVESFYLAQREITTPHPHSQAVKIMAGVAPLEQVVRDLEDEIVEREDLLGEMRAECESVDQDLRGLGIQQGALKRLEQQRRQTAEQLDQVNALIGEVNHGLDTFSGNTVLIERARGARARARILRAVVLLLAVATGALWALLAHAPDLPQAASARDLLADYLPDQAPLRVDWIGYVAAGLGVLFVLLWLRVAGLRRRMARLREESRQLGVVLGRSRELDIEDVESEPGIEGGGDGDADAQAGDQAPPRPAPDAYETLRDQLDAGTATTAMVADYCQRELGWLNYVAERLASQQAELDEDIDDEQGRLQEADNLAEVLVGLTEKRSEVEERIRHRQRGLELLDGAIGHLSNLFNRDVKGLVARLLPLFTDGRYEHLQLDDDLKVRVFSVDKRGFMDLDEVSSGTQRQIMLALRLALSKKLLSRTVKGRQFAFLDEPFAFFDEERTRRALHALTDLGDNISQVFIVAQDFPANCSVAFDAKVFCERAADTLSVTG